MSSRGPALHRPAPLTASPPTLPNHPAGSIVGGMRHRKRWLLGAALFVVTLAVGLLTRRPARALSCQIVFAELQLESVRVGGAPASAAPYAGHQVEVWGLPGEVRLTVQPRRFQGFYEETYHAPPDAGR